MCNLLCIFCCDFASYFTVFFWEEGEFLPDSDEIPVQSWDRFMHQEEFDDWDAKAIETQEPARLPLQRREKVHIFSSLFFTKLAEGRSSTLKNFDVSVSVFVIPTHSTARLAELRCTRHAAILMQRKKTRCDATQRDTFAQDVI